MRDSTITTTVQYSEDGFIIAATMKWVGDGDEVVASGEVLTQNVLTKKNPDLRLGELLQIGPFTTVISGVNHNTDLYLLRLAEYPNQAEKNTDYTLSANTGWMWTKQENYE